MVRTHVVVSLCQCDIGLPYHFLLLRLHKNCCWEYGGHYSENANVVYFPAPPVFEFAEVKHRCPPSFEHERDQSLD